MFFFLTRRTEGSLGLCSVTEKQSEHQLGRWVGGTWQWETAVAATIRSSKNVSTGCKAGKGEKGADLPRAEDMPREKSSNL